MTFSGCKTGTQNVRTLQFLSFCELENSDYSLINYRKFQSSLGQTSSNNLEVMDKSWPRPEFLGSLTKINQELMGI